jgi:negative regulator of flagellin synthesis FlgM
MKIGMTPDPLRPDRLSTGDSRPATGKTQAGGTSAARTTGTSSTGSTGSATQSASLGQLGASMATADFDARKVDEVRAAISEGRFKVDSNVVADGLLQSAADAAGRTI